MWNHPPAPRIMEPGAHDADVGPDRDRTEVRTLITPQGGMAREATGEGKMGAAEQQKSGAWWAMFILGIAIIGGLFGGIFGMLNSFGVALFDFPDQIAARYSLGCDCRSCLASTFRPVGVSIFSASSFSSRCSAS